MYAHEYLVEAIAALIVLLGENHAIQAESKTLLTSIAETNIYLLAFAAIGFVLWVCVMAWKAIWNHLIHVWL